MVPAMFQLTPAILGMTRESQKSTVDAQTSLYIQRGLWPLLTTMQWYMNSQVIADFFWSEEKERNVFAHGHEAPFAGQKMDVMFRFKLFDQVGEKLQLEIDEAKLKNGLTTINAVLKSQNKPTVDWGDVNPMFLYGIQPWCQGYGNGGIDKEAFKLLSGGVEPGIKQVQQAVTVKPKDENTDVSKDLAKSYRKMVQEFASDSNLAPYALPKPIRSTTLATQEDKA
jgi:hypothetical protein